jgi:hypothetical protein
MSEIGYDQLAFPKQLAPIIGYCAWSIGAMKKAGCRFIGRKTTRRWIREFIEGNPHFKTSEVYPKRRHASKAGDRG